jgi:hypothetical protein
MTREDVLSERGDETQYAAAVARIRRRRRWARWMFWGYVPYMVAVGSLSRGWGPALGLAFAGWVVARAVVWWRGTAQRCPRRGAWLTEPTLRGRPARECPARGLPIEAPSAASRQAAQRNDGTRAAERGAAVGERVAAARSARNRSVRSRLISSVRRLTHLSLR